jgi:hypothetical protein
LKHFLHHSNHDSVKEETQEAVLEAAATTTTGETILAPMDIMEMAQPHLTTPLPVSTKDSRVKKAQLRKTATKFFKFGSTFLQNSRSD